MSKFTKKWWQEERDNFDIWISEETLNELAAGNYPHKNKAIEFATKLQVLSPDENIVEIAQIYLDNYVMPQVLKGDAIHLAYASFYKIDFLLTWNCNHLANANKRQHIRRVILRSRFPVRLRRGSNIISHSLVRQVCKNQRGSDHIFTRVEL